MPEGQARGGSGRAVPIASLLVDVCFVLLFVGIGRSVHGHAEDPRGMAKTAWPFLCGLALGWLASRAWRAPVRVRSTGIAIWLSCVVFGMIIRVLAGQGTDLAFILVAAAFLGAMLLGWRALATGARLLRPGPPR